MIDNALDAKNIALKFLIESKAKVIFNHEIWSIRNINGFWNVKIDSSVFSGTIKIDAITKKVNIEKIK